MLGIVPQFLRYADNGSKLVVYKTGHLLTLYTATLDLVRDVDLEMPQWPWTDSDVRRDRVIKGSISDMEVDSAGSRVALLIPWGTHAGGELRVYDLDSGRLVQKWDFPSGLKDGEDPENGLAFYSSRPISISPDGKIVAISLGLPVSGDGVVPSQGKNVLILDVDSGKTVAGINTGSLAGPMCFVPGNPLELATLSLYFHEKNPATNSIRLWNAQTGLLVREIRTSRFAVGQSLDVSADGHILMGFTSRLKYDFSWLGNEYGAKIFDPRIGLWDLTTGKEVAGSSSLLQLLSSGFSYRFRLSPDGHVVLLYANVYRAEEKTKPLYQLHFFEFR
jgi:WD40 repeat protein